MVMELIGYAGGFRLYLWTRKRWPRATVGGEGALWLIAACIFGAAAGSKLLAWLESAPLYWAHRADPTLWLQGKTIVGGLLGGWIGVEIAKKCLRVRHSTGDQFVFPLIFGMAVGRVGCFLTGLDDHTHGTATSLPWGVDFGDRIHRHPTQLYDIVFLILLALALSVRMRRPYPNGHIFRLFLAAYLGYRFLIEFIKPDFPTFAGLSAIQWACAAGIIALTPMLLRARREIKPTALTPEVA